MQTNVLHDQIFYDWSTWGIFLDLVRPTLKVKWLCVSRTGMHRCTWHICAPAMSSLPARSELANCFWRSIPNNPAVTPIPTPMNRHRFAGRITARFLGLICQLMMFENLEMTILMKMKNNFISPGDPKIMSRARSEHIQESSGQKLRLWI